MKSPISPLLSVTMAHVSWAISPALKPAFTLSKIIVLFLAP